MKKDNLMKGLLAIAVAVAITGCSRETDFFDQSAKERESADNFQNLVLGGQQVDANQNWSTAKSHTLNVTSEIAEGTLKVYTVDPIGNFTAPLYTTTIVKGEKKSFNVACPNDVKRLYVAVYDAQNYLRVEPVTVNGDQLNVSFEAEENASAGARRAPGSYYQNSYNFISAPDPSIFASEVPAGVAYLGDYKDPWGGYQLYHFPLPDNTCWLDQAAIANCGMSFTKPNYTIYVKGTVNCTSDFYLAGGTKFYLTRGSKLILPGGDYSFGQYNVQVIVAEGAELVCNGRLQFSQSVLYNNGTVTANSLEAAVTGKIYNSGKLKINNTLSVENNNAEIVNDGEIETVRLDVNGSGHFLNGGKVTVSEDATVNSNNNSWVNNGTFHCKNFLYNGGGSWNVINNCKLICDEQFYLGIGQNQGEFKLDGSIECKNFFHGIGYVKMRGNSIIKVAETLTCQADADGAYCGFYGPESADNGYAVIQAKKITATNLNQRRSITYRNYLIVATDDHWTQCDKSDGNYPHWDQGDNVKMAKSKDNVGVTIEPTDCNAGLTGNAGGNAGGNGGNAGGNGGGIVIEEPTMYYYYAFEDFGTTDDFDFNDVVVRVSAPVNGVSSVEIVAAGGTMETYVTYGEGENPTRIGSEVHAAMGVNSEKIMVNTTNVDTNKFAVLGTIQVAADADLTSLPLGIQVKGSNDQTVKVVRSVENIGRAPLVIVVNGNELGKWYWATERTNITAAYQNFGAWGANASTNIDWYKNAAQGMTVEY